MILNRVLTKRELEQELQYEKFKLVQFENRNLQKAAHMFVSENWLVINGELYCKKYMKNFRYAFTGRSNKIWVTYYNGKGVILPFSDIDLSGAKGEEMKKTIDEIMQGS